jgi:hypothetical protein
MSNQSDLAKSAAGFNGDPLSIDTANNRVGIGTSSPSKKLDVDTTMRVINAAGSAAAELDITSGGTWRLRSNPTSGTNAYGLDFIKGSAGTDVKLSIDGSGNLLVGRTSQIHGGKVCIDYTNGTTAGMAIKDTLSSGTGVAMQVVNGSGTIVGSITQNQSSTAFNTSSDHRLKENVTDVTDGITRVKQLAPKRFNFIADANKTVDGFLAHEAATVVPEAVTGAHNGLKVWQDGEELPDGVSVGDNKLDADGNTIPEYQGIDQSKLVPLLTAALKEAITKIETLETEMASVKARLDALEGS